MNSLCIQCGAPARILGLCTSCYARRNPSQPSGGFEQGCVGAGRFRLIRSLGEGGQGSVWLARDEQNSRDGVEELVALKFLGERVKDRPEALERLRGEVRLVRKLNHPNVVNVFDLHVHPGEPVFYSMEYVPGDDLRRYLAASSTGRLTGPMIEPWVHQVVQALEHCHRRARVYHRDLKPANIVLSPDGQIRLVDFGLAYADASDAGEGASKGMTRAYASPQQAAGNPASAMDDMYSLGATLYHLLTGHLPAPQGAENTHIRTLLRNSGGTAKDLSPEAADTIMRCLSPDPMRRPQSMEQFWLWYSKTGPVDETEPEESPETSFWEKMRLVAALALLVGAAAWLLWGRTGREAPGAGGAPTPTEVRVRLPDSNGGDVRIVTTRVDDQTSQGWGPFGVPVGTNLLVTTVDLKPGEYVFEAGVGQTNDRTGWMRVRHVVGAEPGGLEMVPGTKARGLGDAVVPQTVDLEIFIGLPQHPGPLVSLVIQSEGGDPLATRDGLPIPAGSREVSTHVVLDPGRYWIEAGLGRATSRLDWIRQPFEAHPGMPPLRISLVPQRLEIVVIPETELTLINHWGQAIDLRPSDPHSGGKNLRRVDSGTFDFVPGRYRMELKPGMREDWILDQTLLDHAEFRKTPTLVRLRPRLHPLMGREWRVTNVVGVLPGVRTFFPVTGFPRLLGGAMEVTVAEFSEYARATGFPATLYPSTLPGHGLVTWSNAFRKYRPEAPVTGVTRDEARAYADWLTGRLRDNRRLTMQQRVRLPTCAEWAAMAGTGLYPWGDSFPPPESRANFAGHELVKEGEWPSDWRDEGELVEKAHGAAWNDTFPWTAKVGDLRGEGALFSGMAGNVAEWCEDPYRPEMNHGLTWRRQPERLTRTLPADEYGVTMGGDWSIGNDPEILRRLLHWPEQKETRSDRIGFRLVIEQVDQPEEQKP